MGAKQGTSNSSSERSARVAGIIGLFCALCALSACCLVLWPLRWNLVAFWITVEVVFYLFYWRPRYAELDQLDQSSRPSQQSSMAAFNRMLQYFRHTKRDIDYEMYYSGWFLGANFEDIKRGNAEEFLAYAFWYRTMQEMQDAGMSDVPAKMLVQLEETWGLVLQPGYTQGLRFMGHLWEPLKAQWRPLAFYIGTAAAGWCATVMLKRWGFEQASHQGMAYFTLNMQPHGQLPLVKALQAIQDAGSGNWTASDKSTAASPGTPPASACGPAASSAAPYAEAPAVPPAARQCAVSAPELSAPLPGTSAPPTTPEVSALSCTELAALRSKSSPFQRDGLGWAAQYNSDQHMEASISVASAVFTPEQSLQRLIAVRRSGSSLQRRMHGLPYVLTPRLSAHTSTLLRTSPNPLEEALSEDLANNDLPVLFLHGVGGLPAYLEMLLHVMALGHPVIVVQCTGVSMRLGQVMSADEVVEQVVGVLDKLDVEQACVIGHSYGTFVAGRLARLHPQRVRSLCLIDPVCFGMFMPQLLSNFLYTTPPWRGLHHIVDYVKKGGVYMASHELHVCATFSRNFFWTDLNMWPEDLAPGSVVLLSGRDDLMNAQQVKAMLEEYSHIKVHYNHDLTHGEFLIKSEVKQAVIEEVRTMLRRGGTAVVGLARPVLNTTMTLACTALGVGGEVKMHTAGDGAKYVEDRTNKLVRTFTGNLTAMLHQVHSFRSTFDAKRALEGSSSGGSSARSRLSAMAGGTPSESPSSSSSLGDSVQGPPTASRLGQPSPGSLAQTLSLPIRSKSAKQVWLSKLEEAIQEQVSAASSTALESSGSNGSVPEQRQPPATQGDAEAPGTPAEADYMDLLLGNQLKGGLAAQAAGRRSSGSGSRVLEADSGTPVPCIAEAQPAC